jgi:serine/threonine-protein kinase
MVVPAFATIGTGVLSGFLVSRLRNLVAESRRKDFAGKYLLGERIGAGGMAEVFTATYSPEGGFERRVAVKRVLAQFSEREDFIALFRREAELGAQLAHPNLVQVLDFGRHFESWFLAMEFVDGISLHGLLKGLARRGTQLPVSACLYVLCEVAQGLAYLHEKRSNDGERVGLVHRDLNPPNVLLSTIGEVKLSDFGVARWQSSSELTQEGATRGKLAYMPPEQIDGGEPQAAWDLFAFGVTAHETLTCQRLFKGEGDVQVLRAVLESRIPPPSELRPGIPPEVDAVVMALLERDPSRRMKSARLAVEAWRTLTGADAPYPGGQAALIHAIAGVERTVPAQAPSGPASNQAATVTLTKR